MGNENEIRILQSGRTDNLPQPDYSNFNDIYSQLTDDQKAAYSQMQQVTEIDYVNAKTDEPLEVVSVMCNGEEYYIEKNKYQENIVNNRKHIVVFNGEVHMFTDDQMLKLIEAEQNLKNGDNK